MALTGVLDYPYSAERLQKSFLERTFLELLRYAGCVGMLWRARNTFKEEAYCTHSGAVL